VEPYRSSVEHILSELERIDLLVTAQVVHARQSQARDELPGLYISEQEVDALLAQPIGMPRWATLPAAAAGSDLNDALARMESQIQRRIEASASVGVTLRLVDLANRFSLLPFDVDVALICLAAELDLRYERLYAYLQDDVTKKRPSVDLVLNLLCPSFAAKLEARQRFSLTAPLLKHQLVALLDDPSNPKTPLLSRYVKLDERIVDGLLGSDDIDTRLVSYVALAEPKRTLESLVLPAELLNELGSLAHRGINDGGLNLYLQGPYGVGKRSTADALCGAAALKLLLVDGVALLGSSPNAFSQMLHLICREATLQNAAIYWNNFDVLLSDEQQILRKMLLHQLEDARGVFFLAGETTWEPADIPGLRLVRIEFPLPAYGDRLLFWEMALEGLSCVDVDAAALANKFRFTGGQIRDAALTARNQALQRKPEDAAITMRDLLEACRLQSNRKLATLATNIKPHFSFRDIVLPADRLRQLREICQAVEYRSLLYDEWGFEEKLSLGKGLSLLFAGPSGTGKTMAAEILAGELGLDLYKIDLSTIVSKYIGETEKNLSRIFAEAATSNAILFFDEADALFGKRSEVRDSHDRYANIEINYLLQRMEEYDGVVILATNLRKNMDEAFVRRIHATIEFPFPNAEDRLRIWQGVWPAKTPRADLDLEFLARRFEITGGNIRNIALSAAFLGAEDGGCVRMKHVIRGAWQEYQKMGKVILEGEFGPYAEFAQTFPS
jgi:SpoVK/Ycf46/Vps4 family AAA+-type ATPase